MATPRETPPDPSRSWDNRARAESFGARAAAYDAVRPRYPDALVDAVVEGRPPTPPAGDRLQVLDVGTGTGILAAALTARGADVVGNEIDPAMAAVARGRGLAVHVGPFERLELPERFDRITAGQAWHWIEPDRGRSAARRLLAPGGQLWLVWNLGIVAPPLQAAFEQVYAQLAPQISPASVARGGGRAGADATAATFAAVPGAHVDTLDVGWARRYDRDGWISLLRTHSDHAVLDPATREPLLAALAAAIDDHGGTVPVAHTTHAVVVTGLPR